MLSERYMERRDQLMAYLDLSLLERRFVVEHYRSNAAARRVALLVGQFVEADSSSERSGLLDLLVEEAVPALRLSIEAAALSVPTGYVVVSEQLLSAYRELVEQGQVICDTGRSDDAFGRYRAVEKSRELLQMIENLDSEFARRTAG